MGEFERLTNPYRAIKRALRLLPNLVGAEILPGVGHSMANQQPDWVISRVLGFLGRYAV